MKHIQGRHLQSAAHIVYGAVQCRAVHCIHLFPITLMPMAGLGLVRVTKLRNSMILTEYSLPSHSQEILFHCVGTACIFGTTHQIGTL